MCAQSLSHVQLFETPQTVAHQAPMAVGFSRLDHWSGLPFPSAGDRPAPGIEPRSPALQVDSLLSELSLTGHKPKWWKLWDMIPLWGQIRHCKGSVVAAEAGNPQST